MITDLQAVLNENSNELLKLLAARERRVRKFVGIAKQRGNDPRLVTSTRPDSLLPLMERFHAQLEQFDQDIISDELSKQ